MSSSNFDDRLVEFNKDLVKHLLALDAFTYSSLPTIIAFVLGDGLTPSEQGVVSSFISDIGDELAALALYINAKEKADNDAEQCDETKEECEKMWLIIEYLLQKNQNMLDRIEYLENKIKE